MIGDANLLLSNAQAVTATAVSDSSVDQLAARDIAPGSKIELHVIVAQTVTAAGAATVTFELISADDEALTTNVNVLGTSPAIGKASLVAANAAVSPPVAGAVIVVEANPAMVSATGYPKGQRYLGARYTVATGPLTAGKFTAKLVPLATLDSKNYPSAYTV